MPDIDDLAIEDDEADEVGDGLLNMQMSTSLPPDWGAADCHWKLVLVRG